jgi:hypothetical protein
VLIVVLLLLCPLFFFPSSSSSPEESSSKNAISASRRAFKSADGESSAALPVLLDATLAFNKESGEASTVVYLTAYEFFRSANYFFRMFPSSEIISNPSAHLVQEAR